jgi:hypothetical protein
VPTRLEAWLKAFNFNTAGRVDSIVSGEANMGKYVAYFLCIVAALIALEYFEIVDVPGFDLPDLQTKGEMIHEKSEDNMKRRFGD